VVPGAGGRASLGAAVVVTAEPSDGTAAGARRAGAVPTVIRVRVPSPAAVVRREPTTRPVHAGPQTGSAPDRRPEGESCCATR
jgi:hypothetical protein